MYVSDKIKRHRCTLSEMLWQLKNNSGSLWEFEGNYWKDWITSKVREISEKFQETFKKFKKAREILRNFDDLKSYWESSVIYRKHLKNSRNFRKDQGISENFWSLSRSSREGNFFEVQKSSEKSKWIIGRLPTSSFLETDNKFRELPTPSGTPYA